MGRLHVPIYHAIQKYIEEQPIPFHMPGHKLGSGIPGEFLAELALLDVTEIPGTDNLHYPEGAIKEAQELAAEAFDADKSCFLVNGASGGIHAMIMTVCKPGDRLIISRDCHTSVMGGMILAGAVPAYIKPGFDSGFGIPTTISPSDIEEALRIYPDAVGVLLTRPSYYGICADIEKIAEIVHSYGKVLLVDEAHGAHLIFHDSLPVPSMKAGADMCVQSAHKTLPAFTQGAYLHMKGKRVDVERLHFNLRLLQTTSPSYILMTFLDIARAIMQENGKYLLSELLVYIQEFAERLSGHCGFQMLPGHGLHGYAQDLTRIVIKVRELGISGYTAENWLRKHCSLQVEMADHNNIVCISTCSDSRESFTKLYEALVRMEEAIIPCDVSSDIWNRELPLPKQSLTPSEAVRNNVQRVCLQKAGGRVAFGMITPYPPGIPVLCPGEIISQDIIEYIYGIVRAGGKVNGIAQNMEIDVIG